MLWKKWGTHIEFWLYIWTALLLEKTKITVILEEERKKEKKTYSNCRPQNSTQFFPAKAFSRCEWCFSLSLSQGPRDWRPPRLQDLDTSPPRTVDHHIRDDCKDLNWNFKPCYNPVWTRRKFNFSVLTSTQERKPIEDKKIKWLCKM